MDSHTLSRTGREPVRFSGVLVAQASGRWFHGREHYRGIDLAVYRTAAGALVLHRRFWTDWQGEADDSHADAFDTAAELAAALHNWDPGNLIEAAPIGYPPGEQFTRRQARMIVGLRTMYRERVTEILDAFPEAAEVIP